MSATGFKRVFFLLSTAAFTISLNGSWASAETFDMTPEAIASQKSSLESQPLTVQTEVEATSLPTATVSSGNLAGNTTSSPIFTSADALSADFNQANWLAQATGQPGAPTQTTPDGMAPLDTSPLPATPPDGGVSPEPYDSTPESSQFGTPTQTPGTTDQFGTPTQTPGTMDQFGTPTQTPGTTDPGFTPAPGTTDPGFTPGTTPDTTPAPGTTDPGFTPQTGIEPGRATRSGPSYIGIGGNIGVGSGDTALGEGAFAIFSKIGLTSNLSVRPAVLFSDDPTFLIPLTFDFIPGVTDVTEDLSGELGLRVSPFLGGGVAVSTGDDTEASFLVTGGVDVPLSEQLSAAASLNVTFGGETAIGLILGVGYNF